ncbi:MAG: hypothetical protein R2748_11585 [Bryobacterales bacterium]
MPTRRSLSKTCLSMKLEGCRRLDRLDLVHDDELGCGGLTHRAGEHGSQTAACCIDGAVGDFGDHAGVRNGEADLGGHVAGAPVR